MQLSQNTHVKDQGYTTGYQHTSSYGNIKISECCIYHSKVRTFIGSFESSTFIYYALEMKNNSNVMMDGYHLMIGNSHVDILHFCVTVESCTANRLSVMYIKHQNLQGLGQTTKVLPTYWIFPYRKTRLNWYSHINFAIYNIVATMLQLWN